MITLILAGCSKGTQETSSKPTTGTANTATTAPAANSDTKKTDLKPYKLVLIYPGAASKDLTAVQDAMSKYLIDKINATIELKPVDWGAFTEKVNLMKASNEQFDIVFTAGWMDYRKDVSRGQFLPLDDLIQKFGKDIAPTVGEGFMKGNMIKGKHYGVPTNKEIGASQGLLLRKDMVDKYKFDLSKQPVTLDHIENMLKTIKENEPGITPLVGPKYTGTTDAKLWDSIATSVGLKILGNDLKVFNPIEQPEYMDAAKRMNKWYKAGYLNKDAATMKEDQAFNVMKAGKAFAMGSSLKPGKDAEMTVSMGVQLVQVETTSVYSTTDDVTGAMLAISRTSKDPERAMMFMNMLYTDKTLLNLLDFGIEGKHYVKKGDNVIALPDGLKADTVGYSNNAWMFANQMNTFLFDNEDPKKWDNFKKFNASAKFSPAVGFSFDPEPVKNEIAAVENTKNEFEAAVSTGTLDPETTIPKWLAKQKASGIDKILAEAQKQLDEWAKTK